MMKLPLVLSVLLLAFIPSGFGQSPSCSGSLLFDDQNIGVQLPSTNAYYSGTNGGYTWECWFKLNEPFTSELRPLISAIDAIIFEDQWLGFGWDGGVFDEPYTNLVFRVDGPNSTAPSGPSCSYSPPGGFQLDTWYHVAGVMNYVTHSAILYVNGLPVDSKTINTPPITRIIPAELSYGWIGEPVSLNGNMDEVRIWKRALSAAEIASNYNKCLYGTEANLTLYYRCNDGTGTSVADAGPGGMEGAFTNAAHWSSETPVLTGAACTLDCTPEEICDNDIDDDNDGQVDEGCCPDFSATNDTTICPGFSVQLNASPGFTSYSWTPSTGLSDPLAPNPVASPGITTAYTVTAMIPDTNLLVNSDFGLGNIGFTNQYNYSPVYSPCNYYVAPGFFTVPDPMAIDHTPTSDGMYMSLDGCTTSSVIWEQSVTIEPNSDYAFSFWATRAAVSQPNFKVIFIGDVTGAEIAGGQPGIPAPMSTWIWDSIGIPVWNSGNNHSVTIQVVNMAINPDGNDFGVDDFLFRKTCIQSDVVIITVNNNPILDLGPDLALCIEEANTLDAGDQFLTYHWNDGSTNSVFTAAGPGTYWVTVTDVCGNIQTDTVDIFLITPVMTLGGENGLVICAGSSDSIHLTPTGNMAFNNFHWTPATGLSCDNCMDPQIHPEITTMYHVTATSSQGCMATDSILVTVNPAPAPDAGTDLVICKGDSTFFSFSPSDLSFYQWAPFAGLSCPACPTPFVYPEVSTTYYLTETNGLGCIGTDSVRITVIPPPTLELGNDILICPGDDASLLSGNPGIFSNYQWTPAAGLSCSDCPDPEVDLLVPATYYLTATTVEGCTATDSIRVMLRDAAPENVTVTVTDATCEEGGKVIVEVVSNDPGVLLYSFDQQVFCGNPVYSGVSVGSYLLAVREGEDGCPYTSVVEVGGEERAVYIPNAFTPDEGNYMNASWGIQGNCISTVQCRIFNRWGEEIAVLTSLSETWDGTSKGSVVPDGIYTYVAEVVYASGDEQRVTGYVAVLR